MALAACMAAAPAHAVEAACGTVVVPATVGSGPPEPVNGMQPVLSRQGLADQQVYELLYRPVVWINARHEIDWTQSLASSISTADDRATFDVTLKPYVWSDGVPVTADDVVYCWELIRTLGPVFANYGTGGVPQLVRSVTAAGPHNVEIRLTRPVNPEWFEITGIGLLFALPRHAWGGLTIAQQESRQTEDSFFQIVDGPFRLQHLAIGRYASFTPNPSYGGHKAAIRRLVVTFLQGTDQLAQLQSGQVDMTDLPFEVWDAARHLAGFDTVSIGPSARYSAIIPNLRSESAPFLADVHVRQAIATAIDQPRLIATVLHGNGLPDYSFVPGSMPDFLSPLLRSGRTPLDYDPARADALLDAAGWHAGPDGIRRKGGLRLAFEVLTASSSPTGLSMLQLIRSDLAAVGIDLRIRETEFNQMLARMVGPASGWQAAFLAWSANGYPDATQLFATGSSGNFEHYSNPEMNRMVDAATSTPGRQDLFALENYVMTQQPMIFLPGDFYSVLVRPEVHGVRRFISRNATWSPQYLTLSGAMACH